MNLAVTVVRAPGSEACPEPEHIIAAARRLFPTTPVKLSKDAASAGLDANVLVEPIAGGHRATLKIGGERWRERQIVDKDPACRGLADALAVALVLLLEPDARPLTPTLGLAARREAKPETSRQPTSALSADVETGALGALGWLGAPGAGGFLSVLGAHSSGLALRARAMRVLSGETVVGAGPGAVDVSLWAVLAGPCWRFRSNKDWLLTPCFDFGWGRQQGAASGLLVESRAETRPWLVSGLSLGVARRLSGPLHLTLTGGGSIRLHQQVFSVDGSPIVAQEPVGAFVALGVASVFSTHR
ncbi:MAG: hypothetical protein ACOY0T_20830 [Myxococcota bacterium]